MDRRDGDDNDDDYGVSKRISFTKESAACPAFPHQVHGQGQGARVGERPRVHASILGAETATAGAKVSKNRVSREKTIIRRVQTARGKWEEIRRKEKDGRKKEKEKQQIKYVFFHFLLVQSPKFEVNRNT